MNALTRTLRGLIGLFIDDGKLALTVIGVLVLVGLLTRPSRWGRCRPHPSLTPPCRVPAAGSSGTTHEARQACVMRGRNKG